MTEEKKEGKCIEEPSLGYLKACEERRRNEGMTCPVCGGDTCLIDEEDGLVYNLCVGNCGWSDDL